MTEAVREKNEKDLEKQENNTVENTTETNGTSEEDDAVKSVASENGDDVASEKKSVNKMSFGEMIKFSAYGKYAIIAAVALLLVLTVALIPAVKLSKAEKLIEKESYSEAMDILSSFIKNKKAFALYTKAATAMGDKYLEEANEPEAAVYFTKGCRPLEAEQIFDFNSVVMGYSYITAGISANGKVYYQSNREEDAPEKGLDSVLLMHKFLYKTAGINGIDYSGNVVIHGIDRTGKLYLSDGSLRRIREENGISDAISDTRPTDGQPYVVLLKDNGTIKVISDIPAPLTSTASWKKIRNIYDGSNKIFGIDYTGKLHIAYETPVEKEKKYDISEFPSLQKVIETGKALIGLTVSGKLVITYADTESKYDYDFSKAEGVTDICANKNILIICFKDGSVKALRIPNWVSDTSDAKLKKVDAIVKKVNSWDRVVRVRFAADGIYGIRYDGTVLFTSCDIKYDSVKQKYIFDPQKKNAETVAEWTDIADVISCTTHAVAIRYDGTAVSTGNTEYTVKKYLTSSPENYSYEKKTDGTYSDVSGWQLW